jgi:hypothetical protein
MALVKYNNNSISAVTAAASIPSGDMVLLTTNTISSGVSSSSFTSNIDSTYDTYVFKFINIHAATLNSQFHFQVSTDGGSSYGATATTTNFISAHNEAGNSTALAYQTGYDLAQSTSYSLITGENGTENDESSSGILHLFSPSNTTFVKHFISRHQQYTSGDYSYDNYSAGYFNTTSAINAINFKMSSGNIDSGVIKMYGLSKS